MGRHDGGQMRRSLRGRQPLCGTDIRETVHPDLAARCPQLRSPLHAVVTIIHFVPERVKCSLRCELPAYILTYDDVALGRVPLRRSIYEGLSQGFVVGEAD